MDPFDDLLRGVRTDGALFDLSRLGPSAPGPLGEGAALTLCSPLRGEAWVAGRRVAVGEAAVVKGPEPFEVRGAGLLLTGVHQLRGEVPRRLLRVLPRILVVPDDEGCAELRGYLEAQLCAARPGRQIVLDRMLDWLLVCALRDWFDRPESEPPGWYVALGDPVVGAALRAMHEAPGAGWTLVSLAAEAGVSRTTLARRFTELVGQAPLAYLTEWRMALAADLLTGEPEATVGSVARRVGYADPFGFSAAFKRVRGVSPSAHRAPEVAATAGTTPSSRALARDGRPRGAVRSG
ncbi:helix-turn-helix transcriptional regulator [Streptomyces radicis]|uniref:AraC family transcriptional regulator n=1 Tax=Streptomyces radicis TaxID=1750517 RepID=A0A3A9WV96_9ACTN|nr:AraC family transcriptional regulator [Streptomyces radicis]RKN10037.1 AraC family transcriptional regulator [Streptomyces radicis]RKN24378.1 AraC family transcriptional regulator [Streptomyces radicis]